MNSRKLIVGTGSDLPEWTLDNDDIEGMSEDFDRDRAGMSLHEWVMMRTGVRERHRVRPGEGTSDMGTRAARRALDDAGLEPEDIDLLVLSTVTSDNRLPMSASRIQSNLGCTCKFWQLEHACSGFVDALTAAGALMDYMSHDTALVICSEAVSFILNPKRFMLQTVFGDGAGAVVLQRVEDTTYGLMSWYLASDGRIGEWTHVPAGATKMPLTADNLHDGLQYMRLDYKRVFPFAVEKMVSSSEIAAQRAGITLDDVDWFIPHQTGRNIILEAALRMEQPEEKFFINVDHTGNTSSASIPIALDEANRAELLRDGDIVMMPAIGAGMAWGAVCLKWYDYPRAGGNGIEAEPRKA